MQPCYELQLGRLAIARPPCCGDNVVCGRDRRRLQVLRVRHRHLCDRERETEREREERARERESERQTCSMRISVHALTLWSVVATPCTQGLEFRSMVANTLYLIIRERHTQQ